MMVKCIVSGEEFEITADDLAYYDNLGVPPPSLSPNERLRRRMAFANQRHLFHRTCNGTGTRIISNYPPEINVPVYDIEFWYSDRWNQHETGRAFDFNRSFFEQFAELLAVAPRPNLQRNPQYDENSDFTNYAGKNKNCYLIFDSDKNWDCYYSYSINSCRDVMDCFRIEQCELCYECIDCANCYDSIYLQNCDNCSNSAFLKNCIGCSNCFGSVNMRNKSYCYFNEQLSKTDYEHRLAKLRPWDSRILHKFHGEFLAFARQFPQRFMQGVQNENVIGDYLSNSKNAMFCFDSRKLWDCKYVVQAFDDAKDCMDCTEIGDGVELLYESCYSGYGGHFLRFVSHALGHSSDLTYCYFCPHCSNCFGCVGLHHANYCILNRQYSEADYRDLFPRIVQHMARLKEWGQFFPPQLAPVPYNLSHAQDFMPLSKEQAIALGYRWREEEKRDYQPRTFQVPDTLSAVPETVINELLACHISGRNYKIQSAELRFYQKLGLPLPKLCPDERYKARLALRNNRVLYHRTCSHTQNNIITTIPPDNPAEVLCEQAFLEAMD